MTRCINVNLKQDKIIIKISEDAEQEEIVNELEKKLKQLKRLYQDEKIPIKLTGKVLENEEYEEIEKMIKSEIDVEIESDMPKELGLYNIRKTYNKQISSSTTEFQKGSLRSGQRIETDGSIVIFGDVNSGAEVIAGENIVILGTLRGLAHAGAKGNNNAIIAAERLNTVQVRISNIVREMDKEEVITQNAYMYVKDENIAIDKM